VNEEVDVRKEGRKDKEQLIAVYHILETMNSAPRDTYHCKEHSAESHREGVRLPVERQKRTREERAECCTDKSSNYVWLASEHPKTKDIG
jgi:hypothetical protein